MSSPLSASTARLRWYVDRLAAMSAAEVADRARERAITAAWRVRPGDVPVATPTPVVGTWSGGSAGDMALDDPEVRSLLDAADELMAGEATVLGVRRDDMVAPDWYLDVTTGRRAPADAVAFSIPVRDWDAVGDMKLVWELSRHHHLTVLALAYRLTGDDRYAVRVAEHLRSWWAACPFPMGVHWTSGIEVALRLVNWTWCRRLLDGWPGAAALFEADAVDGGAFATQVFHHCRYLDRLHSVGSSSNNHAIAEAVGLYVGATEVPWFPQSARWQRHGTERLLGVVASNLHRGGLDRELATDYHGFVLELVTVAAVNATIHDLPERAELWHVATDMTLAAACLTDPWGRPARQGDTDRGRVLVVHDDRDDLARWTSLVRRGTLRDRVLAAYIGRLPLPPPDTAAERPTDCAERLARGGQVVLRHTTRSGHRTWLRFDAGPHGHLAIAAHAHADALSIELRVDGTDVLVDPGTYTYRPGSPWRDHFRSTAAHNTLELDGLDQSQRGGPFLWTRHAHTTLVRHLQDRVVEAVHDGYAHRHGGGVACTVGRIVEWEGDDLVVTDSVAFAAAPPPVGGRRVSHVVAVHLHLGPSVRCSLQQGASGPEAVLDWGPAGGAVVELDPGARWTVHQGSDDSMLGWFSPEYGVLEPSITLRGECEISSDVSAGRRLRTRLRFDGRENSRA